MDSEHPDSTDGYPKTGAADRVQGTEMLSRYLAIRVNLLIALILAISLGISSYLTKRNWEQQSVQEAMTKAAIMTATVMNSIVVEMSGFCQKDVQKIVANVGSVPEIDTVRVFDVDGVITHSADPGEIGMEVDSFDYSVYRSKERSRSFKSEGGAGTAPSAW